MSNPAKAGTHTAHPSPRHILMIVPYVTSTEDLHTLSARPSIPSREFGDKAAQTGKPLWLQRCLPLIRSIPVSINHFWQVAGKQLLMIVLLWSAGSHLLTLPAVVCLPEPWQKDRCRQHASCRGGTGQSPAGRLPWSPTGKNIPFRNTSQLQWFPVPIFKQLHACPQFSHI